MRFFCIKTFISIGLVCLFDGITGQVTAQSLFPFDDAGNVLYYEVVETSGLTKEDLLRNSRNYLMLHHGLSEKKFNNQLYKKKSKISFSEPDATFTSNNVYVLYPGKFLKHAKGDVSYKLSIEIKNKKYRYYLHQFQYRPYELNRYGKYEPASGKTQVFNKFSLATGFLKGEEKKMVAAYIETQIELLKEYMQQTITTSLPQEEKVIAITDEW